jgi:uncharacterized protein (TIGR02246 family)
MGLSALDYEEIRQLVARYNFAIDGGAADDWAACFTPDGALVVAGLPEDHPLAGRFEGTAALAAFAKTAFTLTEGRARHWNTNLAIDGDGESATTRCYLLWLTAGAGPVEGQAATYQDRLVKRDGRWLFVERQVTTDV